MSRGTLIYGWGNPGRGDDGIGPAFVEALEGADLPEVAFDTDFQLQVEDSAQLREYSRVLFVDADTCCEAPFRMSPLAPSQGRLGFTTHSVSPQTVLQLAHELFGASPEGWLLGIRGYRFELGAEISPEGRENLEAAIRFTESVLRREHADLEEPDLAFPPNQSTDTGEPCLMKSE